MKVHEWEEYLEQVTSYVRFKQDHPDIRLELRAHLEDHAENLIGDGYAQEEAQKMALQAMGDAKVIGEALDQEHSPVLGWIWWLIRACRIVMVILLLPTVLNIVIMTGMTVGNAVHGYEILPEETYGDLNGIVKPDVRGKIDDVHIVIDEVRRYDKDTLQVCYRTWTDPFARSQQWTFSLGNCFYAEDEQERFYGGGSASGGWISYHEACLENFPEESEVLIIDYDYNGRKFYARISLADGLSVQNIANQEDAV